MSIHLINLRKLLSKNNLYKCVVLCILITLLSSYARGQPIVSTGQSIIVTGILKSKVLYGPPNFGLTPDRDEKYIGYFLKFSPPRKFHDTIDTGDLRRGDTVLDYMQLTTTSDDIDLSQFNGEMVDVEAIVAAGVSGYMVTPYVLNITKVAFSRENAPRLP